jgi:hypothetical protein
MKNVTLVSLALQGACLVKIKVRLPPMTRPEQMAWDFSGFTIGIFGCVMNSCLIDTP